MNACSILRDAFFGQNKDAVFSVFPDLPGEAFGACRASLLVPVAEQLGMLPCRNLAPSAGATTIRYGVGNQDRPWEGKWMETSEPIPDTLGLGDRTLTEHILANCLITGNRYGCCWFVGWGNAQ